MIRTNTPHFHFLIFFGVPIRWVATIKEGGIIPYKNMGKYIIHIETKKKIKPIVLDKDVKEMAPQSPRYTKKEKPDKAEKIGKLWFE